MNVGGKGEGCYYLGLLKALEVVTTGSKTGCLWREIDLKVSFNQSRIAKDFHKVYNMTFLASIIYKALIHKTIFIFG